MLIKKRFPEGYLEIIWLANKIESLLIDRMYKKNKEEKEAYEEAKMISSKFGKTL